MLLLDTNALLWSELADSRLGAKAAAAIRAAVAVRQALICPISYWEVGMSVDRGRVALRVPVAQWRRDLLAAGYVEHDINGDDTLEMHALRNLHADPADRLIVGVAIVGRHTLLTSDSKILAWAGSLDRMDAHR